MCPVWRTGWSTRRVGGPACCRWGCQTTHGPWDTRRCHSCPSSPCGSGSRTGRQSPGTAHAHSTRSTPDPWGSPCRSLLPGPPGGTCCRRRRCSSVCPGSSPAAPRCSASRCSRSACPPRPAAAARAGSAAPAACRASWGLPCSHSPAGRRSCWRPPCDRSCPRWPWCWHPC